jgi:tetratricopeptide (TPR) repeat protein
MKNLRIVLGPLAVALAAVGFVFTTAEPGAAQPTKEELLWRYRNLGKAYFETPTTVAQAVPELKKALDLAPDSFRDRLNYGLALLRSGNNKQAVAELEKAQKQDPRLPYTWFNLGVAYKREAQYPEAIREFEGMIRLVPEEPVSHYNLGLLYNLTNREADAMKQFETAAQLDANFVAPRFQLYNLHRLSGNEEAAAKALAVFLDAKKRQKESGEESEDVEWCYYAELYDPIQASQATPPAFAPGVKFEDRKLAGKGAGLLAIDSTGDGSADLLVWSSAGVELYRGGRDLVTDSGFADLKAVVSIAAGDLNNDGMPDLCVLTETAPLIYRNVKGRFALKKDAGLPAGRFEAALWADFDHDYDLDLFLFGAKSALLRNEEGALRDYTPHFPFEAGRATAAAAFRVVPDSKGLDIAVAYTDRAGVLYRDRMRGVYQAGPLEAVAAGARELRAADVDNDGWIDLVFPGGLAFNREGKFAGREAPAAGAFALADVENRGALDFIAAGAVHPNAGQGRFGAAQTAAAFDSATSWTPADFDADGRTDLAAAAADGSVHVLLNRTQTSNEWLRVRLTGVKNPKYGAGAEVEVKAGPRYQKVIYEGAPLAIGLGQAMQADTVRISWPNGLIQNQPDEKAARTAAYKEAPRLSGSCPMVFAWNGREFEYISDVLGVAPLGASSGDGSYFPVDSDEYLQLPQGALALRDGRYEIRITEELHEVTYLDQVRLIAVDHPANVEIFTNDKFKAPPFPEFRLFGVTRRVYPRAARDGRGRDVLGAVRRRDRVYDGGFGHDYAGRAAMHAIELDFGPQAARDNRAALVLNGWIDWADGSTFMAASQGGAGLMMPYLQVKDASGAWRTAIEDMGAPSGGPKTIVVDLTGKFLSASREVRIVTNTALYWDEVFLTEDAAPPAVRMTALDADAASLSLRGFSRLIVDPKREQPEAYEYARWTPEAPWNPVAGLYTRFGGVRDLVRGADDFLVIMGVGDELRATFDPRALPPLAPGARRDFLLLVDGWSKDADANTAFGDSVEPLPFHGMSQYPYPAAERFPDDAAHRAWRKQYNTRQAAPLVQRLARTK